VLSNHFQDVVRRLNDDRKTSAKYCDITLIVDDHKHPAHKCIFGLLSPFYDKMFSIEMKERYDNEAVMKGISKEVFEAILDFIYTGSITLNMENVFGIIEAVHYMDLPYLKECCITYLGSNMTVENWSGIKAYGERYDYDDLLEKVDCFLSENFDEIIYAPIFVDLTAEELKHWLSLKNRSVKFEEKLYAAVVVWIKHDFINREKYVAGLLSLMKFSEMSLEFLTQVVVKENLIQNALPVTRSVFNAIGNPKIQPSTSRDANQRNQSVDVIEICPLCH